jgi:hypothetical protein
MHAGSQLFWRLCANVWRHQSSSAELLRWRPPWLLSVPPRSRLEAQVRAQNGEDDSSLCRELIYDPRDWDIGKEEAISRMQADELDRLVASGEIKETDCVDWIINEIVHPTVHPDDPPRRESGAEQA